jgi:hypothetical protein
MGEIAGLPTIRQQRRRQNFLVYSGGALSTGTHMKIALWVAGVVLSAIPIVIADRRKCRVSNLSVPGLLLFMDDHRMGRRNGLGNLRRIRFKGVRSVGRGFQHSAAVGDGGRHFRVADDTPKNRRLTQGHMPLSILLKKPTRGSGLSRRQGGNCGQRGRIFVDRNSGD